AASYAERKRLFAIGASSWADYDRALIGPGGGVYKRGAKAIALSPQARAALGCDAAELDSESVVRAVLRADVDLLYNGGIGTFVRAGEESDVQVGDHANDACRISAGELRAKIVVEGGNLGFTQRARIEYAVAGGRINTDAIDNSAGVDMSDHEVNLKILLEHAVAHRELTFDARNHALAACADEVAERVITDNRDQVPSLSLEQLRSRTHLTEFRDHLQAIEDRGILTGMDPAIPPREALNDRHGRFPGLTRPELALATAYSKIDLIQRLEATVLVDDSYLVGRFLRPYFPPTLAEHADVGAHRLRHELIATRAVNELVDLVGSTLVFSHVRDRGVAAEDVVRAWVIATDVLSIHERADELKRNAETIASESELGAFLALERACRSATGWALSE